MPEIFLNGEEIEEEKKINSFISKEKGSILSIFSEEKKMLIAIN